MRILTHRWLEPLNSSFCFSESSKEAFEDQLSRGFGLEFDINFSRERWPFVFHDGSLSRISQWMDTRKFEDLTRQEIESYRFPNGNRLIWLEDLLIHINSQNKPWEFSALHLKSKFQKREYIDIMIEIMKTIPEIVQKIFIFDITIEIAHYIKSIFPELQLFPSVAHPYDMERFNSHTGGTLLSLEEVLANKGIWNGVWLDEWDRRDKNGSKKLYTKEVFDILRANNLKIWLVTPELHGTSPGLLGGECHEDTGNPQQLQERLKEIIALAPDFICSDHPQYILWK